MRSLDRQAAAKSAEQALVGGDMNLLGESVAIAQLQLQERQSHIITVKGEPDEYCHHPVVEEQGRRGFEALLRGGQRRLIYNTSSVDSVRVFPVRMWTVIWKLVCKRSLLQCVIV